MSCLRYNQITNWNGSSSRVVEAAEPVFVYCLPLPIRKENNLTNIYKPMPFFTPYTSFWYVLGIPVLSQRLLGVY